MVMRQTLEGLYGLLYCGWLEIKRIGFYNILDGLLTLALLYVLTVLAICIF